MPLAICKERVVVPVDTIRLERSNDVVTVELPNGMEVRIGFCDQLPDEPRVFVMPGQGTACGIPETFIPLDEHESAVKVPLFAQEEPLRVPEPLAGMLRRTARRDNITETRPRTVTIR